MNGSMITTLLKTHPFISESSKEAGNVGHTTEYVH